MVGSQPRGFLTVTPDGRFSYILLKASPGDFNVERKE
jgi:hypothetical protein